MCACAWVHIMDGGIENWGEAFSMQFWLQFVFVIVLTPKQKCKFKKKAMKYKKSLIVSVFEMPIMAIETSF